MLVSQFRPRDVVLLDNLPVHQASKVEAAVAGVNAEVIWLPVYSPDFSPIDECWSKVKTLVRGREPRTPKELTRRWVTRSKPCRLRMSTAGSGIAVISLNASAKRSRPVDYA